MLCVCECVSVVVRDGDELVNDSLFPGFRAMVDDYGHLWVRDGCLEIKVRSLVLDWLNLRYLYNPAEMCNRKLDASVWSWREKSGLERDLGVNIIIHCRRRQWHPTPVLLPGKSHRQRSLVGCSPRGLEESDMTERLHFHFSLHALEKEMAAHSSALPWRIPGVGEPGGLPSMGSHRVGHDWSYSSAAAAACTL